MYESNNYGMEPEEYQRKLANAPKKAVYKPEPIQCPQCGGMRIIDNAAHKIKCPYCDLVENLSILRYEVDQEAFEEQLEKEQQLKAERLAQYQQDKNRSIAWGLFIAIAIVFLLMLGQLIEYR